MNCKYNTQMHTQRAAAAKSSTSTDKVHCMNMEHQALNAALHYYCVLCVNDGKRQREQRRLMIPTSFYGHTLTWLASHMDSGKCFNGFNDFYTHTTITLTYTRTLFPYTYRRRTLL